MHALNSARGCSASQATPNHSVTSPCVVVVAVCSQVECAECDAVDDAVAFRQRVRSRLWRVERDEAERFAVARDAVPGEIDVRDGAKTLEVGTQRRLRHAKRNASDVHARSMAVTLYRSLLRLLCPAISLTSALSCESHCERDSSHLVLSLGKHSVHCSLCVEGGEPVAFGHARVGVARDVHVNHVSEGCEVGTQRVFSQRTTCVEHSERFTNQLCVAL
jgi:hypothetical protein